MKTIIDQVEKGIIGRVANRMGDNYVNNLEILLNYVLKAGGGNHLEIGSLFGGSAIAVALLKKKYNLSGIVVCIDPLNGYYLRQNQHGKDPSKIKVVPEVIFKNIQKFEVGNRVAVMQSYSEEAVLEDMKFSTAFIDGDHKGIAPLNDWLRYEHLVTEYVIFDNYDDIHDDVKTACHAANDSYPEWEGSFVPDISYVLRRING